MAQIKDIVVKSLVALSPRIAGLVRRHCPVPKPCFDLLKYQVLLDSRLTPWLLKIENAYLLGDSHRFIL